MNGWMVSEMGLTWFFLYPDIDSPQGYFKFLPRNGLEIAGKFPSSKIENLEQSLLNDNSSNLAVDLLKLLSLREVHKDWRLSQLPNYIGNSLDNNYLETPSSDLLLSPNTVELLVEIHRTRLRLEGKIGGK